ncbi:MAG: hypothetical protein K0R02_615 [Rickettsiaceae bacterium]|nr:hypothetical protein [Rickettsiaceae bacterium]
MEQDKSQIIAKEFEQKLLKDIFAESPDEEDEHIKTIQENAELKTKLQQILEGIESEEAGDIEVEIMELLESIMEEIAAEFPAQGKGSAVSKAKLATKMKSLKILLLMQEKYKGKSVNGQSAAQKEQRKKRIQHTKKLIERFVIYEIYKIMNPRRIAGETKIANFINNMITGGLKRAVKYEGGKKQDLAKYSPEMIKKLNNQHQRMKRNNFKGLQI